VHWASWACQPESSDGSAGMQGMESAVLGTRIAEQSAETVGSAVASTGTAAAGHNPLSGLLDGTELPAVRRSGGECCSRTVLE
jgi:hypothetical protein